MSSFIQDLISHPEERALPEKQLPEKVAVNQSPMTPRNRSEPYLVSYAQESLWFLDQFEPASPLYNIPQAIRLTGKLNIAVLQKTLETIVARHDALRTKFIAIDSRPVQVVENDSAFVMPVVNLSSMPKAERESEVRRR